MAREFQQQCGDFGQRTVISVLLYFTLLSHQIITDLPRPSIADDYTRPHTTVT